MVVVFCVYVVLCCVVLFCVDVWDLFCVTVLVRYNTIRYVFFKILMRSSLFDRVCVLDVMQIFSSASFPRQRNIVSTPKTHN